MDCSPPGSSVKFSRQEYYRGCHFLPQGIFLTQGPNTWLLMQLLFISAKCPLKWKWSHSVVCCDPMDCRLSGSSVHGIFQARVLEWIAISFSWSSPDLRGSSWPRNRTQVSRIAGRRFPVWATRESTPVCPDPVLSSTFCFRVQSESHVAFGGLAFGGLVSLIVFNLGVSSAFPCRRTLTFRSLGHFLECSTAWCVCFLVMRFRLKHVGEDTGEWGCVLLIRAPQEACDHGLFPWQRCRAWSLGSRRTCEVLWNGAPLSSVFGGLFWSCVHVLYPNTLSPADVLLGPVASVAGGCKEKQKKKELKRKVRPSRSV